MSEKLASTEIAQSPEQYFLSGGGGFEDTKEASTFTFVGMCEMAEAYAEYRVAAAESYKEKEMRKHRERFMQSIGMIERLYRKRVKQHGDLARLDNLLEEWFDQAERDTRERVAQQLTDFVMEAAKLESGKWPITVSDILELAERIRGKV